MCSTATRRIPLTLKVYGADVPGVGSVSRKRSLVGNSQNDEVRGDDLFDTIFRQ